MFPAEAAVLITASEFHQTVKVKISVNNFQSSVLTINNKNIIPDKITGVITTTPYFLPQEFYYIEPADRSYVCAELNAFFIYFLSQLKCKKFNPSSQRTLTGLSMHKIELLKTFHQLKIPLWKVHLKNGINIDAEDDTKLEHYKATIAGNVLLPHTLPEKVIIYMQRISEFFLLPYIQAYFVSPNEKEFFLLDILTVPDLENEEVKGAVVNYFKPI